jgi:hypothetical protein
MSFNQFLRLGAALLVGSFCLTNSWAGGKLPPKNASDYGNTASGPQNSECSGTPTFDQDGVTSTCFTGSGTGQFLFNFTVDSPSNQNTGFTVNSFTIGDLASGFDDFALIEGCSSNTSTGDPVPCDPNTGTLPFDVNGSVTPGSETFTFTGFTGNQTGNVTVAFDCDSAATCSAPLVTAISAGATTTTTPEPRFYAFLTFAMLLGAGLCRRVVSANKAS